MSLWFLHLHVVVSLGHVVVQASPTFAELAEEADPSKRKRGRGKHTREDSDGKKHRPSKDSGSVTESPVKRRVIINLDFTSSEDEAASEAASEEEASNEDNAQDYDDEGNELPDE